MLARENSRWSPVHYCTLMTGHIGLSCLHLYCHQFNMYNNKLDKTPKAPLLISMLSSLLLHMLNGRQDTYDSVACIYVI